MCDPISLTKVMQYKIYTKLFKNRWIRNVAAGDCVQIVFGNVAAGDCVQIVFKKSNMGRKLLKYLK
jgi:hypothetical protein